MTVFFPPEFPRPPTFLEEPAEDYGAHHGPDVTYREVVTDLGYALLRDILQMSKPVPADDQPRTATMAHEKQTFLKTRRNTRNRRNSGQRARLSWTPEQDTLLMELFEKFWKKRGTPWTQISSRLGMTNKQCRDRIETLKFRKNCETPSHLNEYERQFLVSMHKKHGYRWKRISEEFENIGLKIGSQKLKNTFYSARRGAERTLWLDGEKDVLCAYCKTLV